MSSKPIQIQNNIVIKLDRIRNEMEKEADERLSYNSVVRKLIKESGRWNPKNSKKLKE